MGNTIAKTNSDFENAFDPNKNDFINKITHGFDEMKNRLDNIENSFKDLGKAFEGFGGLLKREIWDPIDHALIQPATRFFDTIMLYVGCSINKLENFWGCFFWYIVYISQEMLHLIITGILEVLVRLTSIDLAPLYYQALDTYGYISDIFDEYVGFQLFIFPYSDNVNEKCFVCRSNPNHKETKMKVLTNELKKEIKDETKRFSDFTHNLANRISS